MTFLRKREADADPHGIRTSRIVILAILIVVLAFLVLTFADLNGGSLDPTDREIRLIVTDSMDGGPTDNKISTIPKDSLVIIHHLDADRLARLQPGDVLAFMSLGQVFTHRIVTVNADEGYFITKGDNAVSPETVGFKNAVGEVTGVNAPLGKAFTWIKERVWFLIICVILVYAAVTAIQWILRWGKEEGTEEEMHGSP